MGTVEKALSLLDHFNYEAPEHGLADLARLAGFDKATTRRHLVGLSSKGLVEQDPDTRRYRIGAGFLRFARIREAVRPFEVVARPVADALSRTTGETVHVSELAGDTLATVYVAESQRANRVSVNIGEKLPFSSTASGYAILAFGPESVRKSVFSRPLVAFTKHSPTTRKELELLIEHGRKHGYTVCDQGFEEGVVSVAAPLVDAAGRIFGTISVASPAVRIDRTTVRSHGASVVEAARQISSSVGSSPHPSAPARLRATPGQRGVGSPPLRQVRSAGS
jgi:DNA-binding IclR family transcriptional regulator